VHWLMGRETYQKEFQWFDSNQFKQVQTCSSQIHNRR
jgi:hypothetical protein